jgi:hypothetical protein
MISASPAGYCRTSTEEKNPGAEFRQLPVPFDFKPVRDIDRPDNFNLKIIPNIRIKIQSADLTGLKRKKRAIFNRQCVCWN